MIKGKIIRGVDNKPPLGVKPRFIHKEDRVEHLRIAIKCYMSEDFEVPVEWLTEYNELIND